MNHYCTYFDRNYLAQGLALWASLEMRDPAAVLWVLALDDFTAEVLGEAGGERLRVVPFVELLGADPELEAVREGRSRNEFIFTLSPCLPIHLFRTRAEIDLLTYLDADLFFFSDPRAMHQELGAGSILITPHRYPRWHDDSAQYGRFNVGVLVFRRDASALACLAWWREQCLCSCATIADGATYGDQKYLDQWPEQFSGVVVSRNAGINAAPWNWAGHRWAMDEDGMRVDDAPLVVFHFAQFRRVSGGWFDSGQLEYGIMPLNLRSRLYGEYWAALQRAEQAVTVLRPGFAIPERGWGASLGAWHMAALRVVCGQFWRKSGRVWFAGRLGLGRFTGHAMGTYRNWQRRSR